MVVLTFALPVSEADVCPFGDVFIGGPGILYPDNYIAVAAAKGITKGVTSTHFEPDRDVTRSQAITMVVRGLESLHPGTLDPVPPEYVSTWGDFSPDHAASARIAEYNGLLDGLGRDAAHPDGDLAALDPWAAEPRGELAQLLDNALILLEDAEPPGPPTLESIHDPDAAMTATYGGCTGAVCHQLNLLSQHLPLAVACDACHGVGAPPETAAAIAAYSATGQKQGCFVCHDAAAFHGDAAAAHRASQGAPCTDCHLLDLPSEHARLSASSAAEGCATCHPLPGSLAWNDQCTGCHKSGGLAPAVHPASPSHASPTSGCQGSGCHQSDLVTIHASTGGGCKTCHSTSSVPTDAACGACHASGSFHGDAAAAHRASQGAPCTDCHLLDLPSEHARLSASSAAEGCATCHPLPGSLAWNDQCTGCHKSGGLAPAVHPASPSHASPTSGCQGSGCHQSDLVTIHASTGGGCKTCHSTSSVPTDAACGACHASGSFHGDAAAAHRASQGAPCTDCHLLDLPSEHARLSASSAAEGCATCHPLPGSLAWNDQCTGCHKSGGLAPAVHPASPSHASPTSGCQGSGCHQSDLVTIHASTGGGCKTCHSTSSVPTDAACGACHASGSFHGDAAAAHRASQGAPCTDCHLLDLPSEHARLSASSAAEGCATCHPLPGSLAWNDQCTGCHKSGGLAPAVHPASPSHASPTSGCQGSGCHQSDLVTIHASTGGGCKTCHSTSSVPTDAACGACHASGSFHGDAAAAHQLAPSASSCVTTGCHTGTSLTSIHDDECAYCHGSTAPTTNECTGCHASDPHTANHTASETGGMTWAETGAYAPCTQCHYTDVRDEHAKVTSGSLTCAGCHYAGGPVDLLGPSGWDKRCADCHTTVHAQYNSAHVHYDQDCQGCHGDPVDARDFHYQAGCGSKAPGTNEVGQSQNATGSCHVGPGAYPYVPDPGPYWCRSCHPEE